jgi:hypothetical protein
MAAPSTPAPLHVARYTRSPFRGGARFIECAPPVKKLADASPRAVIGATAAINPSKS